MAVAIAAPPDDEFPRRMDIVELERHVGASGRPVVIVGEGMCSRPDCGWGPMRAEAGQRGFCPVCAGPLIAFLVAGDKP